MKIAVACDHEKVSGHFGHCESFLIFEVENNKVVNSEAVPNPGHRPGFLPNYLNDLGVNVIFSGGMGRSAINIFNEKGIEVVTGVTGVPKTNVENYLNGSLESTGAVCHEHQHHDECHHD